MTVVPTPPGAFEIYTGCSRKGRAPVFIFAHDGVGKYDATPPA
jgi:hypothetical protein